MKYKGVTLYRVTNGLKEGGGATVRTDHHSLYLLMEAVAKLFRFCCLQHLVYIWVKSVRLNHEFVKNIYAVCVRRWFRRTLQKDQGLSCGMCSFFGFEYNLGLNIIDSEWPGYSFDISYALYLIKVIHIYTFDWPKLDKMTVYKDQRMCLQPIRPLSLKISH